MKTTTDSSDPPFEARHETPPPFRLRDAAVDGCGLQPGAEGLMWEQLRNLAYCEVDFDRFPELATRNPLPT